jgi:hypothetical protein
MPVKFDAEGIYFVGGRCYRVAKLFDECTPRREKAAQKAARLYRNGRYLGRCMIMYEIAPELCAKLKSK